MHRGSRPSRDGLYTKIAFAFAERSTCERGQVGAVIVKDTHIVSGGYNGAPPGMPHCFDVGCEGGVPDPRQQFRDDVAPTMLFPNGCTRATHAEANAIAFAARHGTPCDDGTMYCTHAMCRKCAALVVACGITRVVYVKPYRDDGLDILIQANVEVVQYGT